MEDINSQIETMLPLYFEGKLNHEQVAVVEAWIDESEANRVIASSMAEIYQITDQLYVLQNIDAGEALKSLNSKINKARFRTIFGKIQRVAAVLFIPLLITSFVQLFFLIRQEPVRMMSISTSPGMTASATLPDGTKVKINSNSSLTYPSDFHGDSRNVNLQGEAYFAVAKDARHPFIVSTLCQANIKVYGTHFNIEAYPEDKMVTATLEEGSIAMNYAGGNGQWCEHKIEPGQAITYSSISKEIQVLDTEVDVATSWKDGKLIFRNTPVMEVLHSMSKRFNVDFVVRNSKVYNNSFTGTLDRQRLDRILEIISYSSNLRFKYVSNGNINKERQSIDVVLNDSE